MDIALHKLDQIRKTIIEVMELLGEIEENTRPKSLMGRGNIFDDDLNLIDKPDPEPSYVWDGHTIYDYGIVGIPNGNPLCNCTTELKWHHCPRHGYCK